MYDFTIWLSGHGETKDQTVTSIFESMKRLPYRIDTPQFISGDALIGRSRSIAASRFLKANDSPYMVIIDTDIMFTPEELERLYKAMVGGCDIIGGAYSVASGEHLAIRGYGDSVPIDGNVHEIEYVSTGFMGISRRALETIQAKCPYPKMDYTKGTCGWQTGLPLLHKGEWCECFPFFESGSGNIVGSDHPFYISEDWNFCDKARWSGLKVYLHSGCLVDHVKQIILNAEAVVQKHQVKSPGQLQPDATLWADISEFLKLPMPEVAKNIIDYKGPAQTDDDWVLELAKTNCLDSYKAQKLNPLTGITGSRVLDYGCGIGTAAIVMSNANVVTGYDINPRCIDVADYRKAKHGVLNAEFTTKLPDLKQYQVVTLLNVLECVPDPAPILKELGDGLPKGAKVYHIDDFNGAPGRFNHAAILPKAFVDAGFIEFNQQWAVKG